MFSFRLNTRYGGDVIGGPAPVRTYGSPGGEVTVDAFESDC